VETIYLEKWIHNIIQKNVTQDAAFRAFLGKDHLDRVTRVDIDRYQLYKLRQTIAYAIERSAFYHDVLGEKGITAGDINSLNDIALLPFTEPEAIAKQPYKFACVSLGEIERATTFTSSGTVGPQKKVFFTEKDIEIIIEFMAAGMCTVTKPGDTVMIMLPNFRVNDQSDLLAKAVRKMGGHAIKTGTTLTSEEQMRIVDEHHPTILFATVPLMYRITQESRQNIDLRSKGIKTLFITSGYASEYLIKQLKEFWNCDVHVHYGLTEMGLGVAVECHAHQGYHYNEADLIVEVIDPVTGAVLRNDQEGELVFTTLSRQAMPLIRYRTHDISRLLDGECPCGAATLKRFGSVGRRRESIVKLGGGEEIYPSLFDDLLFTIPEIIDYQLKLSKEGGRDKLHFKVEVLERTEAVQKHIVDLISGFPLIRQNVEQNMVPPEVELVERGGLVRMDRAKKMIMDER
jgi:phenylacetate-coenzyme A ligase PaaK-like adenylate-forming protein